MFPVPPEPGDPLTRRSGRSRWPVGLLAPVAGILFVAGAVQLALTVRRSADGLPRPAVRLVELISPLQSVNRYGLFAVMTTRRPEIVVEGSADGVTWKPYEFRWKPGDVRHRPGFVAPHQPRLDWQMWFAALERCGGNSWVLNFLGRLLQGEPAVLRLLKTNPFPVEPPRYVRPLLFRYRVITYRPTRRPTTPVDAEHSRGTVLPCPFPGDAGSAEPRHGND